MEWVFYGREQIRVRRKKRPMVRIVAEEYAAAWDQLQKDDPGLADTIALLANKKLLSEIEKGSSQAAVGKKKLMEDLI